VLNAATPRPEGETLFIRNSMEEEEEEEEDEVT